MYRTSVTEGICLFVLMNTARESDIPANLIDELTARINATGRKFRYTLRSLYEIAIQLMKPVDLMRSWFSIGIRAEKKIQVYINVFR